MFQREEKCCFQKENFFVFEKKLFKSKKENYFFNKSFLFDFRINKIQNKHYLFITLTFMVFVTNAYSQSFSNRSNLILRSNIQSNTAATTLGSSKNNNAVKAQYVFGQTPLLGSVSLSGVEIRQGFLQPLSVFRGQPIAPQLIVNVYPNPFVDRIQIDFDATPVDDVHTALYDMRGRLVSKSGFKNPSNKIEVDLNELGSGKYMLVINTGTQTFTKHIIKHN
jgi:hypothetical protein